MHLVLDALQYKKWIVNATHNYMELLQYLNQWLLDYQRICASLGLNEREREIKFIGLFENRGHQGPYSSYKPFNHNLYIGIIIFPHIDNPQYTGYDLPKKIPNKIISEKSEGPINLTNHWRKRLWISLHVDLKRLN